MLIILADDLNGALISVAPFAGGGLRTEIALDLPGIDAALAEKPERKTPLVLRGFLPSMTIPKAIAARGGSRERQLLHNSLNRNRFKEKIMRQI